MMRLYKVVGDALTPVATGPIPNSNMVEGWIANQPDLLGLEMLAIGTAGFVPEPSRWGASTSGRGTPLK